MSKKKSKDSGTGTIALNKKARFEYSLEDRYEAGLALQGWEVKALRAEGERLHKEGKHTESMKALAEAKKLLGV